MIILTGWIKSCNESGTSHKENGIATQRAFTGPLIKLKIEK